MTDSNDLIKCVQDQLYVNNLICKLSVAIQSAALAIQTGLAVAFFRKTKHLKSAPGLARNLILFNIAFSFLMLSATACILQIILTQRYDLILYGYCGFLMVSQVNYFNYWYLMRFKRVQVQLKAEVEETHTIISEINRSHRVQKIWVVLYLCTFVSLSVSIGETLFGNFDPLGANTSYYVLAFAQSSTTTLTHVYLLAFLIRLSDKLCAFFTKSESSRAKYVMRAYVIFWQGLLINQNVCSFTQLYLQKFDNLCLWPKTYVYINVSQLISTTLLWFFTGAGFTAVFYFLLDVDYC